MSEEAGVDIPIMELDDSWLTVKQAASRFKKSKSTIYRWVEEKRLEKRGVRTYRDPAGGVYIQLRPSSMR